MEELRLVNVPPAAEAPLAPVDPAAAAAKLASLKAIIAQCGSAVVALSGGVDSAFLAVVTAQELGKDCVAITGESESYLPEEMAEARRLCDRFGIQHQAIPTRELSDPRFNQNSPNRCYYCKNELFGKLREAAADLGLRHVFDGTIVDDLGDHRPGMVAGREHGVRSPLLEAGLTKAEIRHLSRAMDLPTWNKPAMACLSSRFVYGDEITAAKFAQVAEAERVLRRLGFRQLRVRHHDQVARIEVPADDFPRVLVLREHIVQGMKAAGYAYVSLDLVGYRTGSMNETLK